MRTIALVMLSAAATGGALAAQQPSRGDTTKRVSKIPDITVTAAPARRTDAASSITLTPKVLSTAPAINPYDLLRQVAGFEVHDQGQGPGFASNASIRGFSSDHSTDVALWIDGVPINEPVNGHAEGYNDWNVLFPDAVASVEVFKGPSSPLYGNFALAGVVSVRTLERLRGTEASVSGGAYGRLQGTVLTGFDREGSGGVFGIRAVREDGWRPNSSYQIAQGHARLVKDLSPSTAIDAGVELYATGWDSPGFLTVDEFTAGLFQKISDPTDGGFKHRAQERVSLRVVGGSSLLWRSTVYATQGRWQLFLTTPPEGGGTEGSGSQLEEEDRRYGLGATSALTWVLPHNSEITLGTEGRWDHSNYENWFTTSRRRDSAQILVSARQASGALFAATSFEAASWLRFNLGARFDTRGARTTPNGEPSASDTRGVFLPKVGAALRLSRGLDLYANASRGFRQADGVITDPAIPFITAWAYESGIKASLGSFSASAALFRMDVSNEQTFDPITATSTSGGASRRQGVELDVEAQLGPAVDLRTDWTFNDAKYRRLVTEDGDTLSGARVFNTAKYVGSVTLGAAPPNAKWQLQAGSNVVGPYTPFDAPGVSVPAFALFHASGGYKLGRVLMTLGIRNLFDRHYQELRAGDFVVPGQPRSVYATLRYGF
ncbi:MAG: TonB-dependent receptor [Gemmatimonadota bacterium]